MAVRKYYFYSRDALGDSVGCGTAHRAGTLGPVDAVHANDSGAANRTLELDVGRLFLVFPQTHETHEKMAAWNTHNGHATLLTHDALATRGGGRRLFFRPFGAKQFRLFAR